MTRLIRLISVVLLALTGTTTIAPAQVDGGPYAPRVIINDRAVSNYEYNQRVQFMRLLGTPGDLETDALDALIEDRLRLDAGAALGITLGTEEVEVGMEEFANRVNLTGEQFVQTIAAQGIARETFYDFVEAGLVWREVVRARFGPRAQINESEIDRAIALTSQRGGARVLLSEIILRADTPAFAAQSQSIAEQLTRDVKSIEAFSAAARRHSVAPSRGRGGRIDWLELSNLPPQLASQVLGLAPGEISDPVPIPNAIALFQMRALEELDTKTPETVALEYAQYFPTDGRAETAQRVRDDVDVCDDLYGIAKGQPEERLIREVKQVAEISQDIGLELAKLDEGETSTFRQGDTVSVLMLCGRTPELGEDIDREAVRNRLRNQRLGSYADGYIAELRADAIIRTP